nr:hypothetical protein [Lachnospiraceae bacterium]
MPRSIENISENIIKVTYPLSSIPADGQSDLEPIDFTWNGKRVVSQSEVIFTPITVYRYETDDSG